MAYSSKPPWKIAKTSLMASYFNNNKYNPMFLFFSSGSVNNQQKKPFHFTTFSIEPSPSSSSSSSIFTHFASEKSEKNSRRRSDDKSTTIEKKKEKNEKINKSIQTIKNRPLWRRVLFASKKIKSILLLNVITIVYASDIPVLKAVEAIMDPAAFSAVRFFISAIPFLPFVLRARDDVETRNAGIELGLWISLGYLAEALGLLTSDAGRASFLSLFTVIVVPLLDGMLGAIIPARTWFGVLMSALGVGMLECSGSPPNVGDLLNFLSAIFFGIHMLRTERISRSIKKENFLPLLGYEVCVVAVLSTIWVVVEGWFDGGQYFDQSLRTWSLLWDWMVAFPWVPALYTGVFSTGICLWIEIAAMRDVSATETAIIYGLEPLWGAGFAWFLLGERWGAAGWIGAALVLCGSLWVQMHGSSPPNRSQEAEEGNHKGDLLLVADLDKQKLQNSLSTSPVFVRSKKDLTDLLK